MKKKIFNLTVIFLCITLLCSCSNSNILRTKKESTFITQTQVILKSNSEQNEEFQKFSQKFKTGFTVPGLYEGVIPQGICYDDNSNRFIISGYYEDGEYPSVLMTIDAESGKLIDYYPLCNLDGSNYTGHAGGIAVSESTLYITSDGLCYTVSLEAINNTKNGNSITLESQFKLNTKGSFAGYNNGILWIGDFIESDNQARKSAEIITTLDSGETFYAYCEGYVLEKGLPAVKKINSNADGYIPDYMLAIPEQVQGIAFTDTDKIVFSTSYGRKNNSYLCIYEDVLTSDRVGTYTVDGVEIDLFACKSDLLSNKITALPMSEGMTVYDDNIYILFESGASKYRSHSGKYPTDTVYYGIIQ